MHNRATVHDAKPNASKVVHVHVRTHGPHRIDGHFAADGVEGGRAARAKDNHHRGRLPGSKVRRGGDKSAPGDALIVGLETCNMGGCDAGQACYKAVAMQCASAVPRWRGSKHHTKVSTGHTCGSLMCSMRLLCCTQQLVQISSAGAVHRSPACTVWAGDEVKRVSHGYKRTIVRRLDSSAWGMVRG